MTGIALALFTLFIAYIIIWSFKNDRARSIGDQSGLIRMRDPRHARRKLQGKADDGAGAAAPPGADRRQ